jgi:hypothetical protein
MMIDLSKTDIEYINEQEIGEDDASEDELRTATIRFVPAESSAIGEIFNILNKCQEMNPDPDDEQNSGKILTVIGLNILNPIDGNFDDECMVGFGQNGRDEDSDDNEHSWFTQDNVTDEIHLSPEGRANLERILGNLGEGDQPFHQPNFEEDDQNEEMEH